MSRTFLKKYRRPYWKKRIRRHLVLALISGMVMVSIYYALGFSTAIWSGSGKLKAADVNFRLSMATAYTALVLLGITLILGPLNVLRNRPNPVSTDIRRDVGIWTGIIGLIHVLFGLQVHYDWRIWLNFVYASERWDILPYLPLYDLFGLANYAGLGIATILLLLLALSNNISLRKLGLKRWKFLQRWSYGAFALLVFHAAGHQLVESRELPFVLIFGIVVLTVLFMQLAGFRKIRRQGRPKQQNKSKQAEQFSKA